MLRIKGKLKEEIKKVQKEGKQPFFVVKIADVENFETHTIFLYEKQNKITCKPGELCMFNIVCRLKEGVPCRPYIYEIYTEAIK